MKIRFNKLIIYFYLLIILLNLYCSNSEINSKGLEEIIKYYVKGEGLSVIMIKSFEDKEGCSLCQLKWENFEQWKRIKTIFGNKVKIIGLFSREWSEIIKSYDFVEFLPLSNEFEKRLRGVSSYTMIYKDGKVIYEYKGEMDLRVYRKISEIINEELKSKSK